MNKLIIPVIEVLALLSSVVFVILWLNNPSGPYEPPFALSTLIFIATEFFRRYKRKIFTPKIQQNHAMLDIDSKNTMIARIASSGSSKPRNMCLVFYVMKIVNSSNISFIVKDVILRYQYKGKDYSNMSRVIPTGTMYSRQEKKDKNLLIITAEATK